MYLDLWWCLIVLGWFCMVVTNFIFQVYLRSGFCFQDYVHNERLNSWKPQVGPVYSELLCTYCMLFTVELMCCVWCDTGSMLKKKVCISFVSWCKLDGIFYPSAGELSIGELSKFWSYGHYVLQVTCLKGDKPCFENKNLSRTTLLPDSAFRFPGQNHFLFKAVCVVQTEQQTCLSSLPPFPQQNMVKLNFCSLAFFFFTLYLSCAFEVEFTNGH